MKKPASLWTAAIVFALAAQGWARQAERRISVEGYRDKMAANWIGQMAGGISLTSLAPCRVRLRKEHCRPFK